MSVRKSIDRLLKKFEKQFAVHNQITVSRSAILHNVEVFQHLSSLQVIPVLKGNAYGHGIELVALALKNSQLPYIAVDGYFEALRIREVIPQPVLIMGAILPQNFARINYDNFAFVVQDEATIRALGATGKRVNVHLECNTGMNRYGAQLDEIMDLTRLIISYKNLRLEGVMSHLADADGANNTEHVRAAVERFDECVDTVRAAGARPGLIHLAQTAGSLSAQSRYANAMRLGVGLYGTNPFPALHPMHRKLVNLRPALQFTSTITHIVDLQKGEGVSYGYTFIAPKPMRIGVIPAGYYEGVQRALSNIGMVKIGKTFCPIVGRVCMNHTIINLDGIDAEVGDEVVIYSNKPQDINAIDTVAANYDLFNYNLLTALSPDVRRVLVP